MHGSGSGSGSTALLHCLALSAMSPVFCSVITVPLILLCPQYSILSYTVLHILQCCTVHCTHSLSCIFCMTMHILQRVKYSAPSFAYFALSFIVSHILYHVLNSLHCLALCWIFCSSLQCCALSCLFCSFQHNLHCPAYFTLSYIRCLLHCSAFSQCPAF